MKPCVASEGRTRAAVGLVAIALLFLALNANAYRGCFDGDDVDSIAWSRILPAHDFIRAMVNPFPNTFGNFRAAAQTMYIVLGGPFPLSFPPYLVWMHAVHLLTAATLFFLLRRIGCTRAGSLAGTLFFTLNPASLDVYWRPMYVYDATAGLFCALALLAWVYDRWVIAFLCYWLAIKAKESAVMLPLVLLAYEGFLGRRRWKRILPFGAIAAAMVVVALTMNKMQPPDYRFHFKLHALAVTGSFYASHLFGIPLAGILVVGVPLIFRDRRVWFGCAAFFVLLAPMLFLTGRLFSAYLYVPLLGLAVVAGALIEKPRIAALASAAWLAWMTFVIQREHPRVLEAQRDTANYIRTVQSDIRQRGSARAYAIDGSPETMHPWGVTGLLRLLAPGSAIDAGARGPGTRVLEWNPAEHRLEIREVF